MLHCLIDKMCLGTTALGNGSFDFGSEFPVFFWAWTLRSAVEDLPKSEVCVSSG
jgi:hypothetical protein